MERKLKVKLSTFQTSLTFNEWVEKYNVSSGYIEPTKYYQGNAGSPRITMDTRLEMQLSRKHKPDPIATRIGKAFSKIVTTIKSPFQS
jgi:hypothetical protein